MFALLFLNNDVDSLERNCRRVYASVQPNSTGTEIDALDLDLSTMQYGSLKRFKFEQRSLSGSRKNKFLCIVTTKSPIYAGAHG